MVQLKHRIEALKRTVDATRKQEEKQEQQRTQVQQSMYNKEKKELAKYALEEARQKQVLDKKERAASARKERAASKMKVKEELQLKRQ